MNIEDMRKLQKLVDDAWHFAKVTGQKVEENKLLKIGASLDRKFEKAEKK